jgi:hypothetical protein
MVPLVPFIIKGTKLLVFVQHHLIVEVLGSFLLGSIEQASKVILDTKLNLGCVLDFLFHFKDIFAYG